MRDSSEIWCEASDVSIDLINARANLYTEKSHTDATMLFISMDLYSVLLKQFNPNAPTSNGMAALKIYTYFGMLQVKPIRKYKNFLLIGDDNALTFQEQCGIDLIFLTDRERVRIDQAFEDLVLMEGNPCV